MSARTKATRDVRYLERKPITNRFGQPSLSPLVLDPECGRAKHKKSKE